MSAPKTEQTEEFKDLLSQVFVVRDNGKKEYEKKLKKFYSNRCNEMANGVFDGVKLPDVQNNQQSPKENLQECAALGRKVLQNEEQLFYTKARMKHQEEELKELADTLLKVKEIEKIIQNDESHFAKEHFRMSPL